MSRKTPAHSAAKARAEIERIFHLYGDRNPLSVLLDQIEDAIAGIIAEHETVTRREMSDREPAFLSRCNSDSE